ncbi:outer membrane beta-barrel protein [Niabella sp. CC-SYL272]|uniref:outer membrane protein n=1 Tax=Niabella agricola TaxID=2891571 RepID=UPI001F1A38C4|nr:outer membrane beta-barrel protein [Niabella agricola]MCF3111848.1 outer membrane beta-barrel protein [Niabella agricola]
MKVKDWILFAGFVGSSLCSVAQSNGQKDYIAQKSHVGITAGGLGYSGRYAVKTPLGTHTSYAVSAFYDHSMILPSQLFVRGELLFGALRGNNLDEDVSGPKGKFNANILEATVKAEYDILNDAVTRWSPYVLAGAGAYGLFNYASTNGFKERSDKLGFILPVGGGVKYRVSNRGRIFLEGNVRFLSKNLDNHNPDGSNNPNKYYSLGLGFSYSLQKSNQLW